METRTYCANLTGAWFLFYEIKQVAKLMELGVSRAEIKEKVIILVDIKLKNSEEE